MNATTGLITKYLSTSVTTSVTTSVITAGTITRVAGTLPVGNGGLAIMAELWNPLTNTILDSSGNLYISDSGNNKIRKVDSSGIITTVAGNGTNGYSGDGGSATSAELSNPQGIALDSSGNLYIADSTNHRIRKVNTSGNISTIVGTGTQGFFGDGDSATSAQLYSPTAIVLDSSGNLYISDSGNHRIRKVVAGNITTIAGTGTQGFSGDGGSASTADLYIPNGIALDSSGNLYIGENGTYRIRKVVAGIITTVAGTGTAGYSGDGGLATSAEIGTIPGVTVDSSGNLYMADEMNKRIRKIDSSGFITTVAGNGISGYSGDGGSATSAELGSVRGIAIDSSGNLYITDPTNNVIRKVVAGIITTIAGTDRHSGDGGSATNAELDFPNGIASDSSGNVYIADSFNHRIRKINTSGIITTLVGTGKAGYSGDGGPATSAQLDSPRKIVFHLGNLYILDTGNFRIRKVNSSGIITTVAGNGTQGFSGDGGPATTAELSPPQGIALDSSGNLYITDSSRIRKVNTSGTISTIVGTGTDGFFGDGLSATNAELSTPGGIALDSSGNLYLCDSGNHRIRKVVAGIITTIVGTGTDGFSGDGGSAATAQLSNPMGITLDSSGNLYIYDSYNHRIRKVVAGNISTILGTGTQGYSGDGGPATSAQIDTDGEIALDSSGNLYIADAIKSVIRKVSFTGGTQTIQTIQTQSEWSPLLNIKSMPISIVSANTFTGNTGPAFSLSDKGAIFIITSSSAQYHGITTGSLVLADAGFYVYLRNGNPTTGHTITLYHNGSPVNATDANSRLYANNSTNNASNCILYWNGATFTLY